MTSRFFHIGACHTRPIAYEQMYVPEDLLCRAERWADLKRWERRELGQDLRRFGLSYREIGAIIPVPKGTLSTWCRDISLTGEQKERLAAIRPDQVARREAAETRRRKNRERIERIREAAREEAENLLQDPFWVAGVVAYWAEGSKRENYLRISNSDPAMIVLFVRWLERYLDIRKRDLVASLHLHSGQNESDRIAFWSQVIGIEPSQFRKTYIKKEGTGHRKNRLYQGTASVRARCSGDLLHRVMGWIDIVSDPRALVG